MIHEFAVDPEALASWQNFRYLVDNVGVSRGRLISSFPGKWKRLVYKASERCSEMERKRIEEGLSRINSKLLSAGRHYDGEEQWINNALTSHSTKPFRGIVTTADHSNGNDVLDIDELNDQVHAWNVRRSAVIQRTASAMAAAAETLLACSSEVVLVDPHFSGKASFGKPLNLFLQCACSGSLLKRFEYHLDAKTIPADFFRGDLDKQRRHLRIREGLKVVFVRWRQIQDGDAMHPRYILTERGGLKFDYGLDEGNPGETTDVGCLDDAHYADRWNQYHPDSGQFELVDAWIVTDRHVLSAHWDGEAFVET